PFSFGRRRRLLRQRINGPADLDRDLPKSDLECRAAGRIGFGAARRFLEPVDTGESGNGRLNRNLDPRSDIGRSFLEAARTKGPGAEVHVLTAAEAEVLQGRLALRPVGARAPRPIPRRPFRGPPRRCARWPCRRPFPSGTPVRGLASTGG